MIPSVGRIVHYKLGDYEVENEITKRMSNLNSHRAGDVVPMLILRVHASADGKATEGTSVNGRAFLDGQHDLWVTSRTQGDGLSQWSDPNPPAAPAPAKKPAKTDTPVEGEKVAEEPAK